MESTAQATSAWDRHETEKYPNFTNSNSRSKCIVLQYDILSWDW